ncbi:MAG: zinc-binding dehydrogenase [Planctomycetes bacterium]|nr:zinc-binding dehydrogenase [Planctomycetota bacterium]
MMASAIPERMRAVVLEAYREDVVDAIAGLKVVEQTVPPLRRGQALVRVEAAPCNPSDLLLLQGKYGSLKTLPSVPGWEGAGTVVASGGGLLAGWLNGKRVACALRGDRDGTWAEYFVANATECVPLKRAVPFDQAASLIVNPFTAIGLLETARRGGHRAAVSTAAASQLGRMLLAMAGEARFPLVNVVRRDAQVELLKSLGAEHVLNSSSEGFVEELMAVCKRLRATIAFEAIGGNMTGTLVSAMPRGSAVYLYGALSEQPCGGIDPVEVIFNAKSIHGFYLGSWLRRRGALGVLRAALRVQKLLVEGRIETTIQRRLKLDEVVDGLRQYVDNMTDGKVLITPHGR